MITNMWKSSAPEFSYSWYLEQYRPAAEKAVQFLEPIDLRVFNRVPSPGTWSIAECFEHINKFNDLYFKSIRKGFEKAGSAEERDRFPPRFYWRWIVHWFEPPYKIKLKTVSPFRPASETGYQKEDILNRFTTLEERYIDLVRSARQRRTDLSVKTSHPVFEFIKMRITECLAIVDAHQRRHIWQAKQVLKHLERENG